MPVFHWPAWQRKQPFYVGFHTLGVMYYPKEKDKNKRDEFYATLVAEKLLQEKHKDPVWSLLKMRHVASVATIFAEAKKAWGKGSMAGDILLIIRAGAVHTDQGSVSKAIHVLLHAGGAGERTSGLAPITFRNRKSLRDQVWVPFRPVAHLWTAHNIMQWNKFQDTDQDPAGTPAFLWYETAHELRRFHAIAEDYRRFGEAHLPHGQKDSDPHPTLPPAETWRAPDDYLAHLPSPQITIPPESPLVEEILRGYRAPIDPR